MIERLRRLVRQYLASEIEYAHFRHDFGRFLAASDHDALVERLYDVFESACSAFDHNYFNEIALKGRLAHAAWSPSLNEPRSAENTVMDVVVDTLRIVGVPISGLTSSNSLAAAAFSAAPSNIQDGAIVDLD